jgi:glycosidase
MKRHALHHATTVPYAYGRDKDHLFLRLRTAKDDAKSVRVFYRDRYHFRKPYLLQNLKLGHTTPDFDYYETVIALPRNRYAYYFEIQDREGKRYYYDERGIREHRKSPMKPFQFPYLAPEDLYPGEDWLKEAVCYQIFPDRFRKGEGDAQPWRQGELRPWDSPVTSKGFYGGNLAGIREKLPYLEELGVTLLYLTPVFESSSNHKYNTKDYLKIDPHFGTLEEFQHLVKECHGRGIRVILDAVFNHTGLDFFAFQDLLTRQEASPYGTWYHPDAYPVSREKINYYTFAHGIAHMPKLNLGEAEARAYFLEVARYWIKEADVDGYRLDVCDELSHDFLRDLRRAVKAEKAEAVLIGEIMHEAEAFLDGRELDAIMNYPFRDALVDFFAKDHLTAEIFTGLLQGQNVRYREEIVDQMWNLLGSHDTPRFLTEAGGDKAKLKLAAAFQFLYRGVPYIYYGDEVGLSGGRDPLCRGTMPWDPEKQDLDLYGFHQFLARLRKTHGVLVRGTVEFPEVREKAFILVRKDHQEEILALFNRGTAPEDFSSALMPDHEPLGNFPSPERGVVPPLGLLLYRRPITNEEDQP